MCHSFQLEIVQVHERLGTLNSPEGLHVQNSLKDPKFRCDFFPERFRLCQVRKSENLSKLPLKRNNGGFWGKVRGKSWESSAKKRWLCIVHTTLNVTLWQGLGDTSSTCSAGKQRRLGGCSCQKLKNLLKGTCFGQVKKDRQFSTLFKESLQLIFNHLLGRAGGHVSAKRWQIARRHGEGECEWGDLSIFPICDSVPGKRAVGDLQTKRAVWCQGKRYLMTFWQFWCFLKCRMDQETNTFFWMSTTWQRWSMYFTNWFGVNCDWKCWAFLCRWLSAIPTWHAVNRLCVWPGCPWQLRLVAYLKPWKRVGWSRSVWLFRSLLVVFKDKFFLYMIDFEEFVYVPRVQKLLPPNFRPTENLPDGVMICQGGPSSLRHVGSPGGKFFGSEKTPPLGIWSVNWRHNMTSLISRIYLPSDPSAIIICI